MRRELSRSINRRESRIARLRLWFKVNLSIAFFLAIPMVLIFQVISEVLSEFVSWTSPLADTVKNLLVTLLMASALGGGIIVVWLQPRHIHRRGKRYKTRIW